MRIVKKFIVLTREVWIQPVEVEAESKEDAIKRVADVQGHPTEDAFGYSHLLGVDHWTVTEGGE